MHAVQLISPSNEYSWALHAVCVLGWEQEYPAGQGVQAVEPAALISLAAHDEQAALELWPVFRLYSPAAHAVSGPPVLPSQLEERKSSLIIIKEGIL